MVRLLRLALLLVATLASSASAQEWRDPSPHKVLFVPVDQDVQLEVLDWGGAGRPIILLTGLGNTAHVFDDFAPSLAVAGHVYAITRRGYGASSAPAEGYDADRLGTDVLRVIESLQLQRAVVIGHSIGGQELSFLGSKHPEGVAGVVYLDAAYPYAFKLDLPPLTDKPPLPPTPPAMTDAVLKDLATLNAWNVRMRGFTPPEAELRALRSVNADGSFGLVRTPAHVGKSIMSGGQSYTTIKTPGLAIFASPHHPGPWAEDDPVALAAFFKFDQMMTERQAKAIETAVPHVRVVRLARANHYVFVSHQADVLREIRAFVDALP